MNSSSFYLKIPKWIGVMAGILLLLGTAQVQAQNMVRLSDRTVEVRGKEYWVHTVRRGETLYSIAKAYAVSQDAIMRANSMTRNTLKTRQRLLIPKAGQEEETQQIPEPIRADPYPVRPERPGSQEPEKEVGEFLPGLPADEDTLTVQPVPEVSLRMKEFNRFGTLKIAVMLPLGTNNRSSNFADFYKGVLMGLNALKADGISTDVRFFNTGLTVAKVEDEIRSGKLEDMNLIIGPVYADIFKPVADYGASRGIPVVSPLGAVGEEENPFVIEVTPAEECRYQKLFELFLDERQLQPDVKYNRILIEPSLRADTAVLALMRRELSGKAIPLSYTSVREQSKAMDSRLTAVLDRNAENIIFIPISSENAVEEILSRLSSVRDRYKITVVGTSGWGWFNSNQNFDLFFKLNAHYSTPYHTDRSNPAVAAFYREYIDSFGSLPSLYAFRGYDVVKYFGGALRQFGTDMRDGITSGYKPNLLQVDYEYVQLPASSDSGGKYRNKHWMVVNFRPDYVIHVK